MKEVTKKLVALFAAFAMLMAFVPCAFADGETADTSQDVTEETGASEEETEAPTAEAGTDEYGEYVLHYTFDDDTDCGTVYGNTKVENGYAYFDGDTSSYIQMPDNIVAGENVVTFVINVRPEMGSANQFTYTIGSSDGNYLFYNTNKDGSASRFAITTVGWWSESGVEAAAVLEDEWMSVVVVMNEHEMTIYQNGEEIATATSDYLISALGETTANYLAKSQYSGDEAFKGYIADFVIYKEALTAEEIAAIAEDHSAEAAVINEYIAQNDLEDAADTISFDSLTVGQDIDLPATADYASVTWKSGNTDVIADDGTVTVPNETTDVVMTATVTDGVYTTTREFTFTVIANDEIAESDAATLTLVGNLQHLKEDLFLPEEGTLGSVITWETSDESVIEADGTIHQAEVDGGSKSAMLTATISSGEKSVTKSFEVTVEETDYAYLFAYFTGNSSTQERLFYGLSLDGYYFNTLNNGEAVLTESVGTGCIRDPYIFRGQDGYYYCLVTDMQSSLGWSSNYRITTWKSEDLITWTDETLIDCREIFGTESLTRAWAPQAIWDPEYYDEETGEYGAYMIYFAVKIDGEYNNQTQMWKMYTKDMKTIISEPEFFYASNGLYSSDIDADIIYRDGLYYMYVKDETSGGAGGIYVVTSEHAGGPYSERLNSLPRQNSSGSDVAIEGSCIYKLIGQDKYNLIYDAYNAGFFVMSETEDLASFTQLSQNKYGFDFTPRHGYVVTISKAETEALMEAYGVVIPEEQEPEEDAILHYSFEDNGVDSTGNFSVAELATSATYGEGISGQGLYLDGTSESYAIIDSDAVTGLYDYTITAWFKPEKTDTTQRIFDFGTGTSNYMFYTPYYDDNVQRYAMTVGSYTVESGISASEGVPVDEWSYVAITSEGDTIKLYYNGELIGEETGVELDPYEIASSMTCYLGKSQWSSDAMFQGTIDEFKIYNRALSEEEVKAEYLEYADFGYVVTEEESVVTVTLVSRRERESADVVIAEYNDEGIMTGLKHVTVDFTESDTATVSKSVTESYRIFVFDSMESLEPIS
ncbi:MAG: hypothetical protein LUG52_08690 [Clostridia bacterium]|nr:hypothetical protein [Clostridia bacterium]